MKRLFFIFVLISNVAAAQLRQDTSRRVHFLVLPAVFTSPETRWAFGATASMAFKTSFRNDPETRTSTIQALGIYTLNKQYIAGLDATIYFPKEKYILYSNATYSYFPDKFWGLGPATKPTDIERYSSSQVSVTAHLKRKVVKRLFAGLIADYRYIYDLRYWQYGSIDTTNIAGKAPYNMTGLGVSISYDTRNSAFYPTKGLFVQTQITGYNKALGSTYNNLRFLIEGRYFRQLHPKIISASQVFALVNDGTTPLKSMAMLGGADNLRGFYQGRFRDKVYMGLVTELRFPLDETFALTAFGGTGNVSSSIGNFEINSLKFSAGAGIRIAIRPQDRLNLRLDYGYSDKHNSGFYFTIGEAF